MIREMFYLGDNREWAVALYCNIKTDDELDEVEDALVRLGMREGKAMEARMELEYPNTGFTFTSFSKKFTVICVSHAVSHEELFDSISHETKHATEHISSYYGIDPKSEKSAYLQGEISRQMYKVVAMSICPHCRKEY